MTLKDYIANLVKIVEENPEYGDLQVIYSKDDEGNGYQGVYYGPTIGNYESDEREFTSFDADPDVDPEDTCEKDDINAICIN